MKRRDIVLAAMSQQETRRFTPVQLQKLFFLLDQEASELMDGPKFEFRPYNYGPFDAAVYEQLESLAQEGLATIAGPHRFREYALTTDGVKEGKAVAKRLPPRLVEYMGEVTEFVRRLSFAELVSAIYNNYPQMKTNSVFVD